MIYRYHGMTEVSTRGSDEVTGSLFSHVDLEERIPSRHPLRKIRSVLNDALGSLDAEFDRLYAGEGRPSIAPERLIRASLLQILYPIRAATHGADGRQPAVPVVRRPRNR